MDRVNRHCEQSCDHRPRLRIFGKDGSITVGRAACQKLSNRFVADLVDNGRNFQSLSTRSAIKRFKRQVSHGLEGRATLVACDV